MNVLGDLERLREGVHPVETSDHPRIMEVWEASVRATHDFISEADLQCFKPLVRGVLPRMSLTCARAASGEVVGFIGTTGAKIDLLFIHPDWRGLGLGRRLIRHAVSLGAATVDVNEQNEQALGFYLRMGFGIAGRSERDGLGKPYPILHLRLEHPEAAERPLT